MSGARKERKKGEEKVMGRKRWKYRAKGEKKKLVHLVAEDQKSLQINPKLLQVTIIEETYLKHSF